MVYQTNSAAETQNLAQKIAPKYKNGGIIALFGSLGSGKTTFSQGFAQGLGIKQTLLSPTFVLIRQYPIPGQNNQLFHIDLYRLENPEQIRSLGLEEIMANKKNVVLIEWAEKLGSQLPKGAVKIEFVPRGKTHREIKSFP